MSIFLSWTSFRKITTYSLAEGTALANGDLVTFLDTEARGHVRGQVGMSLLVAGVLWDEV